MMHEHEKSNLAIVAVKPANRAEQSAAESVEPRAGAEGNASQQSTHRAQYRRRVSQALERVRQVAVRTRGGSRMREIRSYGSNGMDRPRSIGASVEEERIVNTCSTSHGGTLGSRMIVARCAPSPSSPRLRLAAARLRA